MQVKLTRVSQKKDDGQPTTKKKDQDAEFRQKINTFEARVSIEDLKKEIDTGVIAMRADDEDSLHASCDDECSTESDKD